MAKRTAAEKPATRSATASKRIKTQPKTTASFSAPAKSAWLPTQERAGPSAAPQSKQIPAGEENCLAGLRFVFTGELESLSREEAHALVKRYGGISTIAPSTRTNFVVLGSDAGPKKLELIKKHKLKTINQDQFLSMITSKPSGKADAKSSKKQDEKVKKVEQVAKPANPRKESTTEKQPNGQTRTAKCAPIDHVDQNGNKALIERVQAWLRVTSSALGNTGSLPAKGHAGPSAPGSKPIPQGAENCLAGLTFVFTGELESITRDEANALCNKYGGRVSVRPSNKTSFIVLGSDPGAKKLELIRKNNLKTINEDGFLDLIASRPAGEL
ncbi:hypothetical protein PCASD_04003 [Puccinia coronata f. sp. avenae]|uniref:BRCT domain-containing protein n=1 Tax=Puccinia coronata f. sp. avenae TaxID=200324 RepID=A0A2N5RXV9_9BASI|nr:hypothetical protein PCASD_23431 [Puccinia coronata f. sp. avenae]PLW45214.1 hypothetical protein PCASD_04003 [Puccinia coronata f. sp. avenae]